MEVPYSIMLFNLHFGCCLTNDHSGDLGVQCYLDVFLVSIGSIACLIHPSCIVKHIV